MTSAEAQGAIESLRRGIPPQGRVREFTVGRRAELRQLLTRLDEGNPGALLLHANFGAGKSHLLHLIGEVALEKRYAISYVAVDARSGIRFNRMDQILGAISRNLRSPDNQSAMGACAYINSVCECIKQTPARSHQVYDYYSRQYQTKYSYTLPPLETDTVKNLVTRWLGVGTRLSLQVESQLQAAQAQGLRTNQYALCWGILRDLDRLAKHVGWRGLIILFDEFEDILTNLTRINWQESAFLNLFRFYGSSFYPGQTFYAVTPEFSDKCTRLLWEKDRYELDETLFDALPTFQMSPLETSELKELAQRIAMAHGVAYRWNPLQAQVQERLDSVVAKAAASSLSSRTRHTITSVVRALDEIGVQD